MVRSALGRRGGGAPRKSYAEDQDSDDNRPSKPSKPEEDYTLTDSSSEDEAPARPPPKAPPKKRGRTEYREASDVSEPDDAEMEGDDSDFEVKSKKKTPKKATPKKKSPKKAAKKSVANGKKKSKEGSRASGRSRKAVRYSVDSESEEEPSDDESEEEVPISKRSIKKPSIMKKSNPRTPNHPPVSEMVPTAIRRLKENPRKGSSVAAIKGFIAEEWGVNIKEINTKIKNYIINATNDGEIIRKSGAGASGRFTVPGMKYKPKRKRKKIIKSDEEDNAGDEQEYKPVKRARDEDRERELEDKEQRRIQRQELEYRRMLEKEARPKKPVVKKEEWEVEFIKSKKEVGDELFYLVKFKDYKKLCWEPEENLAGCKELVDNFYLEEKVRLAEEEERRRAEEEEGEYEVGRILEVRFPKGKEREFLIRWKGCGEDDDTWEPESNLSCEELIERFMVGHEKRLEVSEKSLRTAPKKIERLNYAANARHGKRNHGFRVTYEGMDD